MGDEAQARRLSVAFVLPYGTASDGFFPDTLLGLLCGDAREVGHEGNLVRVYYDGRDQEADEEAGRRLAAWLGERRADLVVVDRLFDPTPVRAHIGAGDDRRCVLISRGESFDPVPGVGLVVGLSSGTIRGRRNRRSPTVDELRVAFVGLLHALATGGDPATVPGVSRVEGGVLVDGEPLRPVPEPLPYRPVLAQDVISLGDPPPVIRKTLFGNAGCPFGADPADNPHYAGADLDGDAERPMARLGCAFCCMGGDYQKRPDEEVIASLVEQAHVLALGVPGLQELVLADQHPLRYLAPLLRRASQAGVPPLRWLFAARSDSFVRELRHVEAAVEAAREAGGCVELYLTGFETFCDRELLRYNKGVDAATQLAAVAAMRALAARHPGSFRYAGARGHSLILWSPWTTPEDLGESVAAIRRHGLLELFDELGRNRLRLYGDLPITRAAARDGAVVASWESEEQGAGRSKGYNVEHPWRFLDGRTRHAWLLARALRERLGSESEPAQLTAVVALVSAPPAPEPTGRPAPEPTDRPAPEPARESVAERVPAPATPAAREPAGSLVTHTPAAIIGGLAALEQALARLTGERDSAAPRRGTQVRGAPALFAGACNNGCAACANRDTWLPDGRADVLARVDAARAAGPVVLAGREPTLHPAFLEAVSRARGDDARPVGVVTNGRLLAYPRFAVRAVAAGLTGASVKVFAPREDLADAITRQPGSHAQALAGLHALRRAGVGGLELRAPLHRLNLTATDDLVTLALRLGVDQLRAEVAVDAVGLDALRQTADAVDALAAACARRGLPLEVGSLRAATRAFEWLPTGPGAGGARASGRRPW